MTPEQQKIKELEQKVSRLEQLISRRGNVTVIHGTVVIDGKLNADRVYTQRSGSYVELTS